MDVKIIMAYRMHAGNGIPGVCEKYGYTPGDICTRFINPPMKTVLKFFLPFFYEQEKGIVEFCVHSFLTLTM